MFFSFFERIFVINSYMSSHVLPHKMPQHFDSSAENDCKISEFQEISKRKRQKTQTFFVILAKMRGFDSIGGTFIRKNLNKFGFSLTYSYLCARFQRVKKLINKNQKDLWLF